MFSLLHTMIPVISVVAAAAVLLAAAAAPAAFGADDTPPASGEFRFRIEFLQQLVRQVPTLLKQQVPEAGRFGTGIWIVTDQNLLLPLAAAWSIKDPANPYYHDAAVLEAVMSGGDALIEAQDAKGRWVFRKKD